MAEGAPIDQEITDNDKMMGLLCYVIALLIPLVVLLSETGKARAFQRYHAIQSLGLSVAWAIFALILCIPFCVLELLTGIGGLCLLPLYVLPWLAALYYGIKAYQGEYAVIPVVTDFMVQQGWLQRP
jgi:uncharacterized membrane protein